MKRSFASTFAVDLERFLLFKRGLGYRKLKAPPFTRDTLHDPHVRSTLARYNAADVAIARLVYRAALDDHGYPDAEFAINDLTSRMNLHGLQIDTARAAELATQAATLHASAMSELASSYAFDTSALRRPDAVRAFAKREWGLSLGSLDKRDAELRSAIRTVEEAERFFRLRDRIHTLSRAAQKLQSYASIDAGRVYGFLRYYGAHTGRFAAGGRDANKFNIHQLFKVKTLRFGTRAGGALEDFFVVRVEKRPQAEALDLEHLMHHYVAGDGLDDVLDEDLRSEANAALAIREQALTLPASASGSAGENGVRGIPEGRFGAEGGRLPFDDHGAVEERASRWETNVDGGREGLGSRARLERALADRGDSVTGDRALECGHEGVTHGTDAGEARLVRVEQGPHDIRVDVRHRFAHLLQEGVVAHAEAEPEDCLFTELAEMIVLSVLDDARGREDLLNEPDVDIGVRQPKLLEERRFASDPRDDARLHRRQVRRDEVLALRGDDDATLRPELRDARSVHCADCPWVAARSLVERVMSSVPSTLPGLEGLPLKAEAKNAVKERYT